MPAFATRLKPGEAGDERKSPPAGKMPFPPKTEIASSVITLYGQNLQSRIGLLKRTLKLRGYLSPKMFDRVISGDVQNSRESADIIHKSSGETRASVEGRFIKGFGCKDYQPQRFTITTSDNTISNIVKAAGGNVLDG